MDISRRKFLGAAAGSIFATSGCLSSEEGELDSLYFDTDLDKLETDLDGQELYVNLFAHAEDTEETLESMEIQYRVEGEDVWETLTETDETGNEISLTEAYSSEQPETYQFRSKVSTGRETYTSDTEVVEFVEEINNQL